MKLPVTEIPFTSFVCAAVCCLDLEKWNTRRNPPELYRVLQRAAWWRCSQCVYSTLPVFLLCVSSLLVYSTRKVGRIPDVVHRVACRRNWDAVGIFMTAALIICRIIRVMFAYMHDFPLVEVSRSLNNILICGSDKHGIPAKDFSLKTMATRFQHSNLEETREGLVEPSLNWWLPNKHRDGRGHAHNTSVLGDAREAD